MELWKPVKGFEEFYEVSSQGRLRNIKTRKIRKKSLINKYYVIRLSKEGKSKSIKVHRMVAEAFITNPYHCPQVNHIDGNKLNNCVENLEWVTRQQNLEHAWAMGLGPRPREVIQVKDGVEVGRYRSIARAAKNVGGSPLGVRNACVGKCRRWKGYEWKFA